MYLGKWKLNDYLTFTCNTHSPTTGSASAASGSVTYSIYEDENGTAIVNGSMASLGSSTGFYSERIQLTSASGFENGKTYTIRIQATVGGVTAALIHTFQTDLVIEGTLSETQALKVLLAALVGRSSGGGTTSVTFRDTANSTNRIVATVDSNGNRSSVTLDVT